MTTYTARYGFPQINEGSDNVDVVNDFNVPWATLDTVLGTQVCTSTTRPSSPVVGQLIYESDTGYVRKYLTSDVWQTVGNAVNTSSTRPTSNILAGDEEYETDTGSSRTWSGSAWSNALNRGTASALPVNPLQGDVTYLTDKVGLAYYSGSAWHYATTIGCTSGTRPSGSALQTGTTIYETDTGRTMVYTGSQWVPVGSSIMAAPISTTANGTASSGTTDTIDTVLGNYQFAAIAGRRYRVTLTGLIGNATLLDIYALRVRDSGSTATPTTSSTAVIDQAWENIAASGSSGRANIPMQDTFIASSTGTHTLAFFSQRVSGSGAFTPLAPAGNSGTGARKLWVEDAGAAY